MRKIRNVDKTWDAVREISPSDYHRYFFIKLDKKYPNLLADRLDYLSLHRINQLMIRKDTMLIYVEGGDEE